MSKRHQSQSYDSSTPETTGAGNPILKTPDLGKRQTGTAIATGSVRPYEGKFGDGWFVEVKFLGRLYDLRVKVDTGNHGRLKKIAPTARALKGKAIKLGVKEFEGNEYIAIL